MASDRGAHLRPSSTSCSVSSASSRDSSSLTGLLSSKRLDGWTLCSSATTLATSLRPDRLPVERFLPSHVVGADASVDGPRGGDVRALRRLRWPAAGAGYVVTAVGAVFGRVRSGRAAVGGGLPLNAFARTPARLAIAPLISSWRSSRWNRCRQRFRSRSIGAAGRFLIAERPDTTQKSKGCA